MKNLSRWAKHNPALSRFLIALGHLLAIANALLLGLLLFQFDLPESTVAVSLLVSVFFITYLFYPKASKRLTNKLYWKQKSCDFTFVICYTFLIAVSLNNVLVRDGGILAGVDRDFETATVRHSVVGTPALATDALPKTKAEKRKIRHAQFKRLKTQVKEWKRANKGNKKKSGAVKGLLLFLVIIGALGLALLLASLSCSLSCNGQEGLAIVVLLAGLTGIIWLSVVLIKKIFADNSTLRKVPGRTA